MIVTCVYVSVKPENIEDFIKATKINHENSIKESLNCRFDILQNPDDPSQFVLYEAYENEEGPKIHKETEHYKIWRETVAPWMVEPRKGIPYTVIAP